MMTPAPWRATLAGAARLLVEEGRQLEAECLDLLAASLRGATRQPMTRLAASALGPRPVEGAQPPGLGLIYASAWSDSLGWPAACFLQLHAAPRETRTFVRIQNVDQPAAARLEGADDRGEQLFPPQDLHPWPRPRIFALDYLNGEGGGGLLWQAMDLCEDWLPTDRDVHLTLTVRERGGDRSLDPLVIPRLDQRTLASHRIPDPQSHRFTAAFEDLVAAWRERDPDTFAAALEEVLSGVGVANLSKVYNLWLSAMLAELRALDADAGETWGLSARLDHWRLIT